MEEKNKENIGDLCRKIDHLLDSVKQIKDLQIKIDHLFNSVSETNARIANFKTEFFFKMDAINKYGCDSGIKRIGSVEDAINEDIDALSIKIETHADKLTFQRNIFAASGLIGGIIAAAITWIKSSSSH